MSAVLNIDIETQIKFKINNEDVPISASLLDIPKAGIEYIKINNEEKTILYLSELENSSQCKLSKTEIEKYFKKTWVLDNISELQLLVAYPGNETNMVQILSKGVVYEIELFNNAEKIIKTGGLFASKDGYKYQIYIETEHFMTLLKISTFNEADSSCNFIKESYNKNEIKEFDAVNRKSVLYPGANYFTPNELFVLTSDTKYVKYSTKCFSEETDMIFYAADCLFQNIFFITLKKGGVREHHLLINDKTYHVETNNNEMETAKEVSSFNKMHRIVFYYSYKEEKLKLIRLTKHKVKEDTDIFKSSIQTDMGTSVGLKFYFDDPVILDLDTEEENSFVVPLTEDYEEQSLSAFVTINDTFYFLTNKENLYECCFINENKKEKKEKDQPKPNISVTGDLTNYIKRLQIREEKFNNIEKNSEKIEDKINTIRQIKDRLGTTPVENKLSKQNKMLDNLLETLSLRSTTNIKENIFTTNMKKIYKLLLYKLNFLNLKTDLECYCKYYNKYITICETIDNDRRIKGYENGEITKTGLPNKEVNTIHKKTTILENIKNELYDVLKSNKKEYEEIIATREKNNMNRSYENIFGDYLTKKKPELKFKPIGQKKVDISVLREEKKEEIIEEIDQTPNTELKPFKLTQPVPETFNVINTPTFGAGSGLAETFNSQSNLLLNKGQHSGFVFGSSNNVQVQENNAGNPNELNTPNSDTDFFNMSPSNQDPNTNTTGGWLGGQFNADINTNMNTGLDTNNNNSNFMAAFDSGNTLNSANGTNNIGNQYNFDVTEFRK